MIYAITGTPGTGKSTVSKQLQNQGYHTLDLNEIVLEKNLVLGYDDTRKTNVVDIDGLNTYLAEYLKQKSSSDMPIFLEGHLAHLLDIVNIAIVLRCHPVELRRRLSAKGWQESKLRENLEAEAVDTIIIETMEKYSEDKIFEIDTTNEKPTKIVERILEIVNGNAKGYEPGKIDWSEEILKWF